MSLYSTTSSYGCVRPERLCNSLYSPTNIDLLGLDTQLKSIALDFTEADFIRELHGVMDDPTPYQVSDDKKDLVQIVYSLEDVLRNLL